MYGHCEILTTMHSDLDFSLFLNVHCGTKAEAIWIVS